MTGSESSRDLLRHCPICGSKRGEVLHHQRFTLPEGTGLPESYDVVACLTCGQVYADSPVGQDAYTRFYEKLSKYEDRCAGGGGTVEYDRERFRKTARDILKVLPSRQAAILDVGCANGGLLVAFKELGFQNVTGLDPSEGCVSYVSSRGIHAVQGGIFSSPGFGGTFDCVILSHVLEHVYDLQAAVGEIYSWLKEGGILYAEVPDASRYLKFPQVPFYYFDIEHINHFDACALKNLLCQWGVELVFEEEKQVPVSSSGLLYPAVYTIYRKGAQAIRESTVVYSRKVRDVVVEYVRKSLIEPEYPELAELARTKEKVVVWGAGNFAFRLLSSGPLGACNIQYFVDRDPKKQGQYIRGIDVKAPAKLQDFQGPIIVAAALHSEEIAEAIRKSGLKNRLVLLRR
jgi:SAM-dependent methyltransferase